MKFIFAITLLSAALIASGAVAQNNLLSAYSGGGNGGSLLSAYGGGGSSGDYRAALRSYGGRGSSYGNPGNGYSGAFAPNRRHYHGGAGLAHSFGWARGLEGQMANRALPAPCGNFQRAAAYCRNSTTAWDITFQSQRGW